MKNLRDILTESIFDVDDIESDNSSIDVALIEDKNSAFWNFFEDVGHFFDHYRDSILNNSNFPRHILRTNDKTTLNADIKNPLIEKYDFYCDAALTIDGKIGSSCVNNLGFKSINCVGNLTITSSISKIQNCKFNVCRAKNIDSAKVSLQNIINVPECKNVEFNFVDVYGEIRLNDLLTDNQKDNIISNAASINIYGANLFSGSLNKKVFDDFFGRGKITSGGITKTKNTNNIKAFVNNFYKYPPLTPQELAPAGDISDFVNLKNFKDLWFVRISDNNVIFTFFDTTKPSAETLLKGHARYLRLHNPELLRSKTVDEVYEDIKEPVLKNGWTVFAEKKYY